MTDSTDEFRSTAESAMPEGVGALYCDLWNRVANLHLAWNAYVQLFGKDEETVATLNQCAGSFIGRLQRILENEVFLSISRLTDPARSGPARRENATFDLIRERVGAGGDQALSEKLAERRREVRNLARGIVLQRNRRIAHADLEAALHIGDSVLPGVSRQRVTQVLSAIRAFMHEIELEYLGSQTVYEYSVDSHGAEKLVFWLREGLAHQQCKRRRIERTHGITLSREKAIAEPSDATGS